VRRSSIASASAEGRPIFTSRHWQPKDFIKFSVYSIDTIFILGDGLTRLLLRWEKSDPLLFCSWILGGRGACRVSTEVPFLLPAEYGIFRKTYGIPPDSAVFLQ
jgi:hypothetical protein